MKRIAVIGSLNTDYVAYVDRAPRVGETVLGRSFSIVPGGKGANQAYAMGRMGAKVMMLGAVGADANAALERENLHSAGVCTRELLVSPRHTGIALITVNAQGDNSIVVAQGANLDVSPAYLDSKLPVLAQCDIIVFQLEIPLETVIYGAEKLKAMGKTIVLDPAPAPGPLPRELLENIDYIKPNETELALLTGMENAREDLQTACDLLLRQGVGCVLASLGSQGAYVADGTGGRLYPACKVHAVDTTAAGDSFTAAFVYALSRDVSAEKAVPFANAVAGQVVQRRGAQSSVPTEAEIRELWDSCV